MREILLAVVLVSGFVMYSYAQTQRTIETKFFRVTVTHPVSTSVQADVAQQARSQAALDETVKLYCAAWGEPDVARRRKMLESTLTPEATYTDPLRACGKPRSTRPADYGPPSKAARHANPSIESCGPPSRNAAFYVEGGQR